MDEATSTTTATATSPEATARRLWQRLEVVHTVVYFSPIVADAQARVGLEPGLMSYAAARVGPMGPVGAETAAATFYGFSPTALATVLPAAWEWASPEEAVLASREAVGRTLAPFCEGLDADVARAAELAREVADLQPVAGRPLGAARRSVPWPDEPHLVLWEAATRIRETRGDGHVACLVAADVGGIESHLLGRGDSDKLRRILSPLRGWTGPEWDAAVRGLQARGWLDADGRPTPDGAGVLRSVEARTDAIAAAPWVAFGEARTDRLEQSLATLVTRLVDSGLLPGVVTRLVTG